MKNKNVLDEVLNKGVPVQTPVLLDLYEILKIFDGNDKLTLEIKNNIFGLFRFVSNFTNCMVNDILSYRITTIIGSKDGRTKNIYFSPENYFLTFYKFFNFNINEDVIQKITNFDDDFFKEVEEQLRMVKNEYELKKKYPGLYDVYLEQLKVNKNLLELDGILKNPKMNFRERMMYRVNHINNILECFGSYDLDKEIEYAKNFSISRFIEKNINIMNCLKEHGSEILDYMSENKIKINSLSLSEMEKLELYIANNFLNFVEREDILDKQRYLYYVTNYFQENIERINSNVKISLVNGVVTPKSLYQRYKKVLIDNPPLKVINFKNTDFSNMTMDEVEEFMDEYLKELSANWEFLPHNSEELDRKVIENIRISTKSITDEERKIKEDKLIELYMDKKNFYDGTDPYYRVKGKNTFDGYVGFIYSNGKVVLEKFYNNADVGKIADGEAIYIMGMDEFYDLSNHSKSYLIANKLCKRIIHKGNWQKRVEAEITSDDKMLDIVNETNKLIRKRKIEKE